MINTGSCCNCSPVFLCCFTLVMRTCYPHICGDTPCLPRGAGASGRCSPTELSNYLQSLRVLEDRTTSVWEDTWGMQEHVVPLAKIKTCCSGKSDFLLDLPSTLPCSPLFPVTFFLFRKTPRLNIHPHSHCSNKQERLLNDSCVFALLKKRHKLQNWWHVFVSWIWWHGLHWAHSMIT